MQRPPLFESDSFIYWKNKFETYVKSKYLDLWHVITNGDFQPIQQNPETKLDEVIHFEKQSDGLKKKLAKNNKAKIVIYNALQRKEYERIFMCNTAKEIWKTLLITHQGNNQVKDNKIDIKVTTHLRLWYPRGTDIETVVYADSDHAGDYVDRKSTSGICTFVGCCLTSWFSKKQTALAISTTEAEYVSIGKSCQQALWMKQALIDYDVRLNDVPIMCGNKGAIDLSKNPMQHSRTKHIEIRHHFLRDSVQKGHISIEKVSSVDNITEILTKPLKRKSFNYLRLGLGMMEHIS
ncbi:hypothetical protein Tco_0475433 [Tanacetum coccineum]